LVLLSNLVGIYLFALCLGRFAIFNPNIQQTLADASREGPSGFYVVLMRAIFAGRLIALMVWWLPGAEPARMSLIIIVA
jgi:formate/nitrite transporter FocA (FNT family)